MPCLELCDLLIGIGYLLCCLTGSLADFLLVALDVQLLYLSFVEFLLEKRHFIVETVHLLLLL